MRQLRFLITLCALVISTFLHAEVVSGICGPKLTWTFNSETGLLKIEGSGEMNDYSYSDIDRSSNAPWETYHDLILALELPEGLTNIGRWAFYDCNGLTSVSIPNTVTNICNCAFSDCSALTSVSISNSVTSIGSGAFSDCSELISISIPNSVSSIGNYAFSGCIRLTSVSIPNSVTSIGQNAFNGCIGLTSITIPNSVTIIEREVFSRCSGLTSISIPNSVTSIGQSAFQGCSGLTSISIPNSVTTIGDFAFEGCSGLTSISISNSLTSIGYRTFCDCSGLTFISIPNSVSSIGNLAFYGCIGLTSISIPNSVTSIGEQSFSNCIGLTSVSIPNSVTNIGDGAFSGCIGLTDPIIVNNMFVFLPNDFKGAYMIPSNITKIIGGAFGGCIGLTSISIPNSVTNIGEGAFSGCIGLTSISIPNSVTSITGWAFTDCIGLTSISIPNSVISIGERAFYGCSGLTSVSIPNSVTSIGRNAFYGCDNIKTLSINSSIDPGISCEEVYIGDDVNVVQNNYFNRDKLRKVVLGKKVSQIRANAFSDANIQEFKITGEEPPYCYPNIFGAKDLGGATLYVPANKATYYQTTEPWTKFGTVKTLSGETPQTPNVCAKPVISYENGQLVFNSSTTGAKYHCTITSPDMKSDVLCEIGTMNLDARYDVSVYATADGYTQSETATATLYWIKADGNLTTDNINSAKMRGIVVTADKGFVNVSGLNDGEQVQFFAIDGKMLGCQKAVNGKTSLSTSESVVICKMGTTSLKVLVK